MRDRNRHRDCIYESSQRRPQRRRAAHDSRAQEVADSLRQFFLIGLSVDRAASECDPIEEPVDAYGVDAKITLPVALLRTHLNKAFSFGSRPNLTSDISLQIDHPPSQYHLPR